MNEKREEVDELTDRGLGEVMAKSLTSGYPSVAMISALEFKRFRRIKRSGLRKVFAFSDRSSN